METENTKQIIVTKNGLPALGFILGISLIISTIIGGSTFYKIRALDNTLVVTGSAKQSVVSDQVKWSMQVTRNAGVANLAANALLVDKDSAAVKKFLLDNGVTEDQITVGTPMTNEVWQQNAQAPKEYTITQSISVSSGDVEKISNISKTTQPILSQGIIFTTISLEYYYSKLPDLRVSLLSDAIKDAKARAEEIAKSGGKSVGDLKSASSGVVQVLSAGSTEVTDYGSYNTAEINKEVMVTVKATFNTK